MVDNDAASSSETQEGDSLSSGGGATVVASLLTPQLSGSYVDQTYRDGILLHIDDKKHPTWSTDLAVKFKREHARRRCRGGGSMRAQRALEAHATSESTEGESIKNVDSNLSPNGSNRSLDKVGGPAEKLTIKT